jgi:hypothetical protein
VKSVQNWIPYLHNFSQIFIPLLAIFLMLRFDFRLYLNLEIPSTGFHLLATSSPRGAHLSGIFFHVVAMLARVVMWCPPVATALGINPPRSDSPGPSRHQRPHSPPSLVPSQLTSPPPTPLVGALGAHHSGDTIL